MHKNSNMLETIELQELIRQEYNIVSFFQKKFSSDYISLNIKQYYSYFRKEISRLIYQKNIIPYSPQDEVCLENLHTQLHTDEIAYNLKDGINNVSTKFYNNDDQFIHFYQHFVTTCLYNYIEEPFYFQAIPTIRIHCPASMNSHFYPRYHSDIQYGHPPQEINVWLPLTAKQAGHGFQIINFEDSKKIMAEVNFDNDLFMERAIHDKEFTSYCNSLAKPVEIEGGEILLFDSRCIHSALPMISHTRISMDIRIITVAEYNNLTIEYQGKGRRKIIFAPGQCYNPSPAMRIEEQYEAI